MHACDGGEDARRAVTDDRAEAIRARARVGRSRDVRAVERAQALDDAVDGGRLERLADGVDARDAPDVARRRLLPRDDGDGETAVRGGRVVRRLGREPDAENGDDRLRADRRCAARCVLLDLHGAEREEALVLHSTPRRRTFLDPARRDAQASVRARELREVRRSAPRQRKDLDAARLLDERGARLA